MHYQHITDNCFEEKTANGISRKAFDTALAKASKVFGDIRKQKEQGNFPILNNIEHYGKLAETRSIAEKIASEFDELVVLGTGGSTLNPQCLVALRQPHEGIDKRVYFIDSIDPDTISAFIAQLDLETTAFLVTSKSGKTVETLAQFLIFLNAFDEEDIPDKGQHFFVISDPGENPVRSIAWEVGATILDHEKDIGGRFASFTNVALIPAIVTGFDAQSFIQGAQKALEHFLASDENEAVHGAALAYAFMKKGIRNSVMMPYMDRLSAFTAWYRQIWAESLGKEGKGGTPIKAIGSLDQHSQLQLYLDGPKDKLFNIISLDTRGKGDAIGCNFKNTNGFGYLDGKTVGDVNYALQQSTISTLIKNKCPVREIRLKNLDEAVLGELMLHFILETVITAGMLDINAFDQPAVEDGKSMARKMLSSPRG